MRWMVLILGLFLSGCYAHYQPRYQGPPPLQTTSLAQANAMVGVQQPVAYKVGFMGGCDSGYLSAGYTSYLFKKDTDRFATDEVYQQGWNDGFSRCASGERVSGGSYSNQRYYGYDYYYPRTFYSGFYYPSYYYAPGYSLWSGYYTYPRHRHQTYSRNYNYAPWSGGHKHKGRGFKKHRGDYYIGKPHKGRGNGGGHKSRDYKGRGNKKRGGHRGGGNHWVR